MTETAAANAGGDDASEADSSAAAAVASVLAAPDHYAALGAPRDAAATELHKLYLRASVRVHPDKNQHPDATKAFQRVAAAWAVLGNNSARRHYDAELAAGCSLSEDGSFYGGAQPSPEDAFATFAFATAACASSGYVGDFAETLFWAQRLAQLRQAREAELRQQMAPPTDQQQMAAAASGLAISAGFFTLGILASMAGAANTGRFVRRIALVNTVGQAVAVAQVPTARAWCAERAEHARQTAGDAAGALRSKAETFLASESTAQLLDRMAIPLGGAAAFGSSCVGALRHDGSDEADDDSTTVPLPLSALVRIEGLVGAVHLNGRVGEVVGVLHERERYKVQLLPATLQHTAVRTAEAKGSQGHCSSDSSANGISPEPEVKLVRRVNLELVSESSAEPPECKLNFF